MKNKNISLTLVALRHFSITANELVVWIFESCKLVQRRDRENSWDLFSCQVGYKDLCDASPRGCLLSEARIYLISEPLAIENLLTGPFRSEVNKIFLTFHDIDRVI